MKDTPGRLSAAVIGAGAGGLLSLRGLLGSDRYRVEAVVDWDATARARACDLGDGIRGYPDLGSMLTECSPEVVCVSTYPGTHRSVVERVLELPSLRGILVEKPLADTYVDGRTLLDAVKRRDVPMVVPHALMAQSTSLEVLRHVTSGSIGKLRAVEAVCTGWDVMNAGIHWIQFFERAVAGDAIASVLAATDTSTRTARHGLRVETDAVAVVRTASGVRYYQETGDAIPMQRPGVSCIFTFVGDEGLIEYGSYESHYYLVTAPGGRVRFDVEPLPGTPHGRHLEYLAEQIRLGSRDYEISESSLLALEIVDAIYTSAREHGLVLLPLGSEQPARHTNWVAGSLVGSRASSEADSGPSE